MRKLMVVLFGLSLALASSGVAYEAAKCHLWDKSGLMWTGQTRTDNYVLEYQCRCNAGHKFWFTQSNCTNR